MIFGGQEIDCSAMSTQLALLVDGELDTQECAQLEEHLEGCPRCKAEYLTLISLKERMRQIAVPRLSEHTRERLVVRVASARSEAAFPAHARLVTVSAAAALVVGIFFVFMPLNQGETSAPAQGEVAGVSALSPDLVQAVVYWHNKDLPVEVTGPSPRSVQSWLNRQLNFGLDVPEFGRGTNLLGGRMSYVSGEEAALLLYEAGGRKLSVLAFPAEALDTEVIEALPSVGGEVAWDNSGGLIVAAQQRQGIVYTYASSLPESEVRRVVDAAQDSLTSLSLP